MADDQTARPGFAPSHKWDRNFFLILLGFIWLAILVGFGSDMARHFKTHEAPYPLIVHFHAAAFVGWLVLLTVQIFLIRFNKWHIHKRLGIFGACLAIVMVILGPATAMIVDGMGYLKDHQPPVFLAVQFTDIGAFAGLVAAAILLRRTSAAHKRLILLATLYITDAGFARFLGDPLEKLLGDSPPATWCVLYLCSFLLVLALGIYDLVTRKRLHPAYIGGVAWIVVMQVTGVTLLLSPWWAPISMHFIGH